MRDRRFVAVSTLVCMLSGSVVTTAEAGCFDWLFRRNKSQSVAQAAPPPTSPRTVAAYPPKTQGGCGPGWCQQTVVRYMPQIAYRTVYQPVPVTTYKTSTSINPANGLPRTCTRPCTSYQYQARRVPYTTYRPVYTTVPVSDPLAATQPVTSMSPAAPATPWRPATYQSGYASSPSCSGCSQPAVQASPWTSSPPPSSYGSSISRDPAGATEWQPLNQAGGAPSSTPPFGGSAAPSSGQTPADLRPSLKPQTSGKISVPEPKAVQEQRASRNEENEGEADDDKQNDDVTEFNRIDRHRDWRPLQKDAPSGQLAESDSLFETPSRTSPNPASNDEPALEPPSNQDAVDRGSAIRYRAIRDVHRQPVQSSGELNDRTAAVTKRGQKPLMQVQHRAPVSQTRYAAIPKQRQPASVRATAKPRRIKPRSANGWIAR